MEEQLNFLSIDIVSMPLLELKRITTYEVNEKELFDGPQALEESLSRM